MNKNPGTYNGKIKISVNVPERLVIELDKYRAETVQDRSVWITSAIMEKISSIRHDQNKRRNSNEKN